jgi:hypothetical protein
MLRSLLAASFAALLLCGCVPNVIRVHQPQSVEAFCGGRVPQVTSVLSVLTSAEDKLATFPVPTSKQIYENVKATGGVIAHWDHQPLLLPGVAKELGYPDGYLILGDAAITNRQAGVDTRRMYLTVQINGGAKIISVRAFDLQDICNEGAKSA